MKRKIKKPERDRGKKKKKEEKVRQRERKRERGCVERGKNRKENKRRYIR